MKLGTCLLRLGAAAGLALAVAACGPGDSGEGEGEGETADVCDGRGETFEAGMKKTGAAGVSFTLVEASPSPPDVGLNRWVVEVDDGSAVEGAAVRAIAFMPDHGHGPPTAEVDAEDTPGTYKLEPIDFFMSGYWEVDVEVGPADDPRDSATFAFCAEG